MNFSIDDYKLKHTQYPPEGIRFTQKVGKRNHIPRNVYHTRNQIRLRNEMKHFSNKGRKKRVGLLKIRYKDHAFTSINKLVEGMS